MTTLYRQALNDLNTAIDLEPRDVSALHNRGFIWEKLGDLDRALADYSRAIELNPSNPDTYISRGSVYLKRAEYYNAAIDETIAIQLDQRHCDPIVYFYRAEAYRGLQRWHEALADYREYLDYVRDAQANVLVNSVLINPMPTPTEVPTDEPQPTNGDTPLLIDTAPQAETHILKPAAIDTLQPADVNPSIAMGNKIRMLINQLRITVDGYLITPILLMVCAVLLWFISLGYIDLQQMNDLGLVSVLPVSAFVALGGLILSFCFTMRGILTPRRELILYANVITLIVMLYGLTSFLEDHPHIGVTWALAGFAESIARTGTFFTWLDARYSWPGFFSASALLTRVAGLSNPILLANWAALFLNLIYLPPLQLIFRTLTDDRRIIWLAVWLFYLLNWVGQDYFSPQGFNYFIELAILALLLGWFKGKELLPWDLLDGLKWTQRLSRPLNWLRTRLDSPDTPDVASGRFQRTGLIALVIVLYIADASSHQLTPIAVLLSVGALVVLNRCSLRTLPILFGILMAAWISYMTTDYLQGNLVPQLAQLGDIGGSVGQNVTSSVHGSIQHQIVIYVRLAMSLIIWVLAFLGGLRRLQKGRIDLTCLVLMVAPFPILGMNSYGGEALLRIYFFALPFASFLAAALIFPALKTRTSNLTTVAIGMMSVALVGGFLFTRYGNERMDYYSDDEVTGVQYLYKIAPPGSRFVTPQDNFPGNNRDVEKYTIAWNPDVFLRYGIPAILNDMTQVPSAPTYLLITRSQKAYAELYYGADPGWGDRLQAALIADKRFRVVFSNRDALVMVLADQTF